MELTFFHVELTFFHVEDDDVIYCHIAWRDRNSRGDHNFSTETLETSCKTLDLDFEIGSLTSLVWIGLGNYGYGQNICVLAGLL